MVVATPFQAHRWMGGQTCQTLQLLFTVVCSYVHKFLILWLCILRLKFLLKKSLMKMSGMKATADIGCSLDLSTSAVE